MLPSAPAAQLAHAYQHFYQPQPVPPTGTYAALPLRHQLTDVACRSYVNAYCQTASLQMMNRASTGDIHYYNWLTGFTYGACFQQDIASFLPYNDPEVCFQPAAQELGLRRCYYVTDEAADFGQFLRALLVRQLPVRVALNSKLLLGKPGFFPHAVVVVGYEGDEIAYYETGGHDRHLLNYAGERTTLATLAQAAAQMQQAYHYPWRYNLTVFEPAAAHAIPSPPPLPAKQRNGHTLAGVRTPLVSTGAQALRALAEHVSTRPIAPAAWQLAQARFAAGVYTRQDNAAFLRRQPSPAHWLGPAADWLAASGQHFAAIVAHLAQPGDVSAATVAEHLLAAAALEERAARLLLQA